MKEAYDFITAKQEYREFCELHKNDIQIFAQPWYLDAVCKSPDDWRVIVYKESSEIVAAFPFQYTKGPHGFWSVSNPWQAPRLGIWINYGNRSGFMKREALENTVTEYVIDRLPPFDRFQIAFDARYRNWRVFYDKGFSQKTFYSSLIPATAADADTDILETMPTHRRKNIKKIAADMDVVTSHDIDEYIRFFLHTYAQRNRKPSYEESRIEQLLQAVFRNSGGEIYFSKDSGRITAAIVCFYDKKKYYNMFGTFDPTLRVSPTLLLTYKAIQDCISSGRDFDFEGSMIPGVAQYNREFNAQLEPYFVISKYSPRFKFRMNVKENLLILSNWLKPQKRKSDNDANK